MTDVVTIERASHETGASLSTLGYWILSGMLEARVTAEGRVVSLSDVQRVAGQVGLALHGRGLPTEVVIRPRRDQPSSNGRHGALDEVAARMDALERQLTRIDHALTGHDTSIVRIESTQRRDGEALNQMRQTLAEHAAALRQLEAEQSVLRAQAAQNAAAVATGTARLAPAPRAERSERAADSSPSQALASNAEQPPLVLRFRTLAPATSDAPEPRAARRSPTVLRMREIERAAPPAVEPPAVARAFGIRFGLPRVPFGRRRQMDGAAEGNAQP